MKITTIHLSGKLEHRDSRGFKAVISKGVITVTDSLLVLKTTE